MAHERRIMEPKYFNAVQFIEDKGNTFGNLGHFHEFLNDYRLLHGTTEVPIMCDEDDTLMQCVPNYFMECEDLPHRDEVRPTFNRKVEDFLAREINSVLVQRTENLLIVLYPYGFGLFTQDYTPLGFIGSCEISPELPEFANGFVVKGGLAWISYEDEIVAFLNDNDNLDLIAEILEDMYLPSTKVS